MTASNDDSAGAAALRALDRVIDRKLREPGPWQTSPVPQRAGRALLDDLVPAGARHRSGLELAQIRR